MWALARFGLRGLSRKARLRRQATRAAANSTAIAGLSAQSVDGAGAFACPLIFLPFISSAFVPTASMPPVVRAFAENQPVTSIVEALRALLSVQPVGNDIWIALAGCVGIMLVAHVFAMRAHKQRI